MVKYASTTADVRIINNYEISVFQRRSSWSNSAQNMERRHSYQNTKKLVKSNDPLLHSKLD